MQIIYYLIGSIAWLIVLWTGSTLLEATGMQRAMARFQAISALTATGFTTSKAESVVNDPRRRHIVTVLIIIGSIGIVGLIVSLLLFVQRGTTVPSPSHIITIVITVAVIILLAKLGIYGKITSRIVRFIRNRKPNYYSLEKEIVYEVGNHVITRVPVNSKMIETTARLKDTSLIGQDVTILAIEREGTVISLPRAAEPVLAGDYLLCYGTVCEMPKPKQ